ncbi:OLC1v1038117C1 [Oldenlandia corymbosa var. corymbosa]|uniref:OLC1v1038117C1 n=1 Tax=Oldenlandia corymbosa var. corymbosa TaxID=529605 RepID=A0AAV1D0J3_OLDCO|nr:OLC1v1038117C1 [Oldenlandia corymbosa var. corymbosa]
MIRCLKSTNPFIIISLFPLCFVLIVLALCNPTFANSLDHFQDAKIPEFLDANTPHPPGNVEPNTRRIAAENAQNTNSTYLILAADRTHRRDPSDDFNFYTGGWNITDPHYLFVSGYNPFLEKKKTYGYSKTAYAISVICLTLFTLAAVGGFASLHVGQKRFQDSIVDTVAFVLHQADTVIVKLKDLVDNLLAARNSNVGQSIMPRELQANIDDIQKRINDVSGQFRNVTQTNSDDIRQFLNPLRLTLIVFSTALLVLAFLGYLCSIFGLQCIVHCLVIFGWILVALTFILSGVFLLVHNVVADTCVAMGEWLQNPDAHSALESIIPKVDNKTAQDIFLVTKGVTFGLITMINVQISNVSNVDMPPNAGPLFYNQSGPLVPLLCNPYDENLKETKCASGEVSFDNASQVWNNYVCKTAASGNCATRGRITPNGYNEMMTTVNVSHTLYTDMPFVVDLIDSAYLKELFGEIKKDYCPNLERYTKWMYVGFTTSSAAVMMSLILWIIYARERRHRKYTKKVNNARSSAGVPLGYRQNP